MTSTPIVRGGREALPRWTPHAVLCGVDGSRGSAEAVRQAVTLAGEQGAVEFALVTWATGTGTAAQATIASARAEEALEAAAEVAREAGVTPHTRTVVSDDPAAALLELADEADLLVVGPSRHSRAGGIFLGRVGTVAAHRAPCDLLLARPAPGERPFPADILFGFDGSAPARRAAAIAGEIAQRHDSRVTVASFNPTSETRSAIAEVIVDLTETTGREPVVVSGDGDASHRLTDLATAFGTSLVVLGARGLTGVSALGSVSERVAQAAPCSVLIARGGDRR